MHSRTAIARIDWTRQRRLALIASGGPHSGAMGTLSRGIVGMRVSAIATIAAELERFAGMKHSRG